MVQKKKNHVLRKRGQESLGKDFLCLTFLGLDSHPTPSPTHLQPPPYQSHGNPVPGKEGEKKTSLLRMEPGEVLLGFTAVPAYGLILESKPGPLPEDPKARGGEQWQQSEEVRAPESQGFSPEPIHHPDTDRSVGPRGTLSRRPWL